MSYIESNKIEYKTFLVRTGCRQLSKILKLVSYYSLISIQLQNTFSCYLRQRYESFFVKRIIKRISKKWENLASVSRILDEEHRLIRRQ